MTGKECGHNNNKKKGKVTRVLWIKENICHICFEEECKEKVNSSGYDN